MALNGDSMAGIQFTSRSVPVSQRNNALGLNSTTNALSLEDTESSDLLNIDFDRNGSFKKRNGYTKLNDSAFNGGASWTSLHWFETTNTDYLLGTCGNKVAKMDALDGTWDDITEDQSVTFTGAGLDDATSGGTYTGNGDIEYKVVIDATGTPDTYEWFKDSVSQASGVSITGAAQNLDEGLTITFAATTGHTLNDQWVIHPAIAITAGDTNKFEWITYESNAFGTNNVDLPIKWDSTGNAVLSQTPANLTKAKTIEIYESYMFMANVELSSVRRSTRMYWSAIDDPTTWGSADWVELGLNDGQDITKIKTLGDRLVIFKERSIYIGLFTGDSAIPFVFKKSPSAVGCDAQFSVQAIENGLLFHSHDGWYYFDGLNSKKMSDKINTTLQGYNQNLFSQIVSCYQREKNRYWGALPTTGITNNGVVTWDSFNNAFSIYDGMAPNCITTLVTSGSERVYFGDYNGFVYRADFGIDDYPLGVQTSINGYFYSKWFDFSDLANQKATPHVVVYYQYNTGLLTFAYNYDLQSGDAYSQTFDMAAPGALWDSAIWDVDVWGASGGSFYRCDLIGRGRVIRYKFENNVVGETFQIDGFGTNVHLETYV